MIRLCLLILSALLVLITITTGYYLVTYSFSLFKQFHKDRILVMYIFSNTDPVYAKNLEFFVREAVRVDDGCDYVFVVQEGEDIPKLDPLPTLPRNARYLFHPNEGYDWGTFGWLIMGKRVDIRKYDYFVFVNSSVRGPYLPPYIKKIVRWVDLLLAKLNDRVKLVGPTVNCEGSPKDGDPSGEWRTNPHVQSYVMATDRIGMDILIEDGRVLQSYESFWDTIYHSELGASLAIMRAGYNVDSFMMRYQQVNWVDKVNWACNARTNPSGEYYYDGVSLHPFEVLFVKVKDHLLYNRWGFVRTAYKFDMWMQMQEQDGHAEVLGNEWKGDPIPFKVPFILAMERRGGE
eukprot:TRINITY_DN2648_c1_g2_i2.p1 TRINITY_DN2648_c1_g2~~TRINITY_DN2648_c1_g2_i2.p1  ORF type:complete len:379 (-),score=31.30 TRINITY_DN2648_c1_g2_i2:28-1068(-)